MHTFVAHSNRLGAYRVDRRLATESYVAAAVAGFLDKHKVTSGWGRNDQALAQAESYKVQSGYTWKFDGGLYLIN